MSLTSRKVSRLAVLQYPPHMRSAISTSGMLRYRVRTPSFMGPSSSYWRKSRQRALPQVMTVGPFLCRQSAARLPIMPHISSRFWSGRVNFSLLACDFKREKKYWNDGLMYVFCRFREKKRQIFRASAQVLHAWRGDFADDLSRFCILSYSRVCCKLLAISL